MTAGVCGCKTTMQTPWTHQWCARVVWLPVLPQEWLPPPGGRLPAPASRATWEGIGERLSMTKGMSGCRGMVPMLWKHPGGAERD